MFKTYILKGDFMNIGLYLEQPLAVQIQRYADKIGSTRNAIIRMAIKDWLKEHDAPRWPKSVLNFKGVSDFPAFESQRENLLPPNDDPLS